MLSLSAGGRDRSRLFPRLLVVAWACFHIRLTFRRLFNQLGDLPRDGGALRGGSRESFFLDTWFVENYLFGLSRSTYRVSGVERLLCLHTVNELLLVSRRRARFGGSVVIWRRPCLVRFGGIQFCHGGVCPIVPFQGIRTTLTNTTPYPLPPPSPCLCCRKQTTAGRHHTRSLTHTRRLKKNSTHNRRLS